MSHSPEYIWPEVFTNADFEFPDDEELCKRGKAIADGLCGWANCMAGAKPPEFFGQGMVKVLIITGAALCKELSAAQKKWLEDWEGRVPVGGEASYVA